MKLVAISDTHNRQNKMQPIPKCDVLVHTGDLTMMGHVEEVERALEWLGKLKKDGICREVVLTVGNHDWLFDPKPRRHGIMTNPALAEQMCKDNGLIYLNDSGTEIDGVKFWGSPITPEFCRWAFMRDPGAQIESHWALIPAGTNVLMTHGPPYGILDETPLGEKVGCRSLWETVIKIRPQYHLFGHIHDGYGEKEFMGIKFKNASTCDERYQPVNAPFLFEIDVKKKDEKKV